MKGDVSPVVYIIVAIVIVVAIIAVFFIWQGKFVGGVSKGECVARISEACNKFYAGVSNAFDGVPNACAEFYNALSSCKATQNNQQSQTCIELCARVLGQGGA